MNHEEIHSRDNRRAIRRALDTFLGSCSRTVRHGAPRADSKPEKTGPRRSSDAKEPMTATEILQLVVIALYMGTLTVLAVYGFHRAQLLYLYW